MAGPDAQKSEVRGRGWGGRRAALGPIYTGQVQTGDGLPRRPHLPLWMSVWLSTQNGSSSANTRNPQPPCGQAWLRTRFWPMAGGQ